MEINSVYIFDAPVDRVWEALLDPDTIANCLPGCEKLLPVGVDKYEADLTIAVGAIRGRYKAQIALTCLDYHKSYTLTVEGSGSPGFVKGQAQVHLESKNEETHVMVYGSAQVGGMIARVGQRLMSGVNKMMMDRFFSCMQQSI